LPPERFVGSPVTIDEFAHHKDFLGLRDTWDKPLGPRQLSILEEFFAPNAPYTELILLWGKGAGKDHTASVIIAYMVYRTLLLEDPQAHYDQAPGHYIDFVNVAQSAEQAQLVFFESSLKPKIAKSPWFNDPRIRGKFRRNKIIFPKNVRAISTHSQNESFEGFNILGWVMDEAAAFQTKRGVDNAKKIWDTLRTSMTSRFGRQGCGCILSYPRHQGDFILKRYADAENQKWALRDRGATWEINPTKNRGDFQDDYDRDPIDAAAKYECFAPIVEDAYLDPQLVAKCLTGVNMELVNLPPIMGDPGYVVCLDPAIYADEFGLVVAYKRADGKMVVPCVRLWKPDLKMRKPVDLNQIETEVTLFAKLRNAHILTDGQGIGPFVQKWQAEGIPVTIVPQNLNAQMEQWSSLKQAMQSNPSQVEAPNDPDLARQLTRLRINRMGAIWKVEAQRGEHDDLADPLSWATWALSGAEGSILAPKFEAFTEIIR